MRYVWLDLYAVKQGVTCVRVGSGNPCFMSNMLRMLIYDSRQVLHMLHTYLHAWPYPNKKTHANQQLGYAGRETPGYLRWKNQNAPPYSTTTIGYKPAIYVQ